LIVFQSDERQRWVLVAVDATSRLEFLNGAAVTKELLNLQHGLPPEVENLLEQPSQ
jgi:hypothetical protein